MELLMKQEIQHLPELLRQAQAGNSQAFIQLCEEHTGHVFAVCLRMLANADLAKEVAQETIVKAWQQLKSFRGESPFGAWIHRIAINTTLDFLRVEKRLAARVEFTDEFEPFDMQDSALPVDVALDLEDAIATLPLQARAVLLLHDYEGYTHEEIGSMLGIASGTSKAQLHRARTILKKVLS